MSFSGRIDDVINSLHCEVERHKLADRLQSVLKKEIKVIFNNNSFRQLFFLKSKAPALQIWVCFRAYYIFLLQINFFEKFKSKLYSKNKS